jgi:hypothetical protein
VAMASCSMSAMDVSRAPASTCPPEGAVAVASGVVAAMAPLPPDPSATPADSCRTT